MAATPASYVPELILTDSRRTGSYTIDLTSSAGSANQVGYALVQDSLKIWPTDEEVQFDPVSFGDLGQAPRIGQFKNRVIEFQLNIKGTSQADAHAKYG